MRDRRLVGVLLLALLAVAAWFAFDAGRPRGRRTAAREGGGGDPQVEQSEAPEKKKAAPASARDACGVVGRVTAAGRALAGASVYLRVPSGVRVETTDAGGRFRFVGTSDESGTVSARALGYAHSKEHPVTFSTDPKPVEILMGVGVRIEGLVVDEGGVAIDGAEVFAQNGLCNSRTKTNERGEFRIEGLRLDAANPRVDVSAFAEGFESGTLHGGPETDFRFELKRPAEARVRVVRASDGAPLPKAIFEVNGARTVEGEAVRIDARLEDASAGLFRLGPIYSGCRDIRVRAAGYAAATIPLPPPGEVAEARLIPVATLRGRLIGTWPRGDTITVHAVGPEYRTAACDGEGNFAFTLPPGRFALYRDVVILGLGKSSMRVSRIPDGDVPRIRLVPGRYVARHESGEEEVVTVAR